MRHDVHNDDDDDDDDIDHGHPAAFVSCPAIQTGSRPCSQPGGAASQACTASGEVGSPSSISVSVDVGWGGWR
jgi:hypothetical protein